MLAERPAAAPGRHLRAAAVAAALLLAGVPPRAQSSSPSASAAVAPPPTAAACMACHGPGGNSPVAVMPSIAAQPKLFIENQLVLIREGLRDVPVMKAVVGNLSDEEIVALARFFSAQPALPSGDAAQADKLRAGADVSRRALCGTCHLPGYTGQNQVPRLAGQQEAYLAVTMKMYRDNPAPGRDTAMSAALHGLKDADLENLAHYLAQQGR